MKLFFSYQTYEVIWPDYLADFLEASTPVKFVEHGTGSGIGLGTYPYVPTDDESSDLRDYGGYIYILVEVEDKDENGLVVVDGEVYKEKDGIVYKSYEVDDEEG